MQFYSYTQRFLYCFIFITFSVLSITADDWRQYQGPNRNLISSETNWRTDWDKNDPAIIWKNSIGFGFASISVVGDHVFTMGNIDDKDNVWCFDAKTGKEVWHHTYDCKVLAKQHEGGPCATPSIDNDSVYTISKMGQMFCLDAKTGKVKWEKDLIKEFGAKIPTWYFAGSVLLEENDLIIDIGQIVRMDKKGNVIWKTKDYGTAYSTPIAFNMNNKRYIAALPNFGLVILDAKSGKEVKTYKWDTRYGVNATTPLFFDNKIFLSCGYNKGGSLLEINLDGEIKELWHNRLMRNHMNTCVLKNDFLFGFDESTLKCIDVKTGKDVWKQRGLGKGSLMLAGDKLIILSEKGELVIAEAVSEAFKPICRKEVLTGKCWTMPVFANGRIYARNAAGDLICLDVQK
jgi:outer membrane protein assembly factor BamB